MVPFLDVAAAHAELAEEIDAAVLRVLHRGWYVLGPEVEAFEAELAAYCGVSHAVGVGSGLDALRLALQAAGVGPGHEVLVPGNTFVATFLAVLQVGAVPVPVEPELETALVSTEALEAAISPRTRGVIAVHLYGQPVDGPAWRALCDRRELVLVEDAAQAHGARVGEERAGSWGHLSAFSFYPGKNLGAAGDGGAVTTDDPELAARLRRLRNYGGDRKYVHDVIGHNSRLDEIQAAVLRVKLPRLDAWNARREAVAARYLEALADLPGLALPRVLPGRRSAWHLFVVRHPRRDALAAALAERGVQTGVHYPNPPHLSGACVSLGLGPGDLPVTERLAGEVLSLPIGPHLSEPSRERVVEAVVDAVRELG